MSRSSNANSVSVNATFGDASGATRLSMVSQRTRQLRMQRTAIRLAKSLRGPQFWVFRLAAQSQDLVEHLDFPPHGVQLIFSIASERLPTARLVMSFQLIGLRHFGVPLSVA